MSGFMAITVTHGMGSTRAYLPQSCDRCSAYVIADVTHRNVQQLQGRGGEKRNEDEEGTVERCMRDDRVGERRVKRRGIK